MEGRKNLVAVGPEAPQEEPSPVLSETAPEPEAEVWIDEDETEANLGRFGWVAPTAAVLVVLGWTAFFFWVHQREILAGAAPGQWADWIVAWSVPVLLVVALWLLVQRNSRREAARFGAAAHLLSHESALLERRLSTVNRELSLAREFIAAQSRDLESLGRVAAERLSQNSAELQALIHNNGAQVDAIGRVSTTALENMNRLRDDLPVISNSARDVASQIGHAGGVAKDQLDELVAGFNRLNEFGEASGRQVTALRSRIEDALSAFSAQTAQLEEITGRRFAELNDRSSAFRNDLDAREVEAIAAMRRRVDVLREELDQRGQELAVAETSAVEALQTRLTLLRDEGARLAQTLRDGETDAAQSWSDAVLRLEDRMLEAIRRVSEVDQHAMNNARERLASLSEEAERVDTVIVERAAAFRDELARRNAEASEREAIALEQLNRRLAAFDEQITERQQEHLAHVAGLAERGDALAQRLTALSGEIGALALQGQDTQDGLTASASTLAGRLAESRALIEESSGKLVRLTDDSVRLLELIRSSADHSGQDLPAALEAAEGRLHSFREQATALTQLVTESSERSGTIFTQLGAAQVHGAATLEQVTAIETRVAEVARATERLSAQTRDELSSAIAALGTGAENAVAKLQDQQADAIRALADRIATDSNAAIDEALRTHAVQAIADLDSAARGASETGRRAATQLRDQLAAVNELASNLERRVAHARQRAEEQVDNDFSRRMALITESLNSNAIDISKAFANEVTDTAWASYLRGDRGVFTRRAVRLLDNADARGVAEIYESDVDFRETVNRYIHDFEAMLRSVLSTRDGHALAVTLLSSDMGKLYVALAQAIERLRA